MSVRSSFAAFLLVAAASAVSAQTPAPPAPQTVPPFVLQSDNGDNRVQLGGVAQMDGRFADAGTVDTFLVRRARISLQGRVAGFFDFYIQPEFAGGAPSLFDAYLDIRFSDAIRVRTGKAKVPFGLERLQSAPNLLFVERALPTALVPNRDVGVQLLGELWSGTVSYGASLTNGVADGASGDIDANEAKDVAARVLVRPLARNAGHLLAGLAVGIAASTGDQPAALPTLRTSAQQAFFSYAPGAVGAGRRTRLSPQAAYYAGPFGGFAEYVRSAGDVSRGGVEGDIAQRAWQLAGSWVLTGEDATDRGVRPRRSFDPVSGTWGAVQVATRYSALDVDDDAVALAFAAPGASRTARVFTAGVNWYANPYVRWLFNVERTVFDGDADGPRPAEHAFLVRAQVAF